MHRVRPILSPWGAAMDPHSSSLPPAEAASAHAPTVLSGDRLTLGQMLRLAREQRALTLQQISELTTIQLAHLEAYERDDLAGTVPGMYQRAEIRAIADAVGLDSRAALMAAERRAQHFDMPVELPEVAASLTVPPADAVVPMDAPLAIAPAAAPVAHRPPVRRSIKGDVAVALLTVVVIALAWFTFRTPHVSQVAQQARPAPSSVSSPSSPAQPAAPQSAPSVAIDATVKQPVAEAAPVSPSLRVITEPAGARVTVDGVGWGQTPVTIRYLSAGSKRIRVTRDGYAAREQVVAIAADQPQTIVRLALQRRR